MEYDDVRQAALALHIDQREYLGFLLLRSLSGLSPKEIESSKGFPQIDSKLMRAAFSLPRSQRHRLSTRLMISTEEGPPGGVVSDEEWREAWRVEIERRVRESDEGRVKSIPWEEVKRKGRELLDELRDPS